MLPGSLSLLSCVCLGLALALPAPVPVPQPEEDRMVQPLSAAASGNYTISFMPLVSVLINMFPRIMSRMRVQALTGSPQSRKLEALWEWEQASLCAMIESAAWTSRPSPCHFYSCRVSGKSYCKGHSDSQTQHRGDGETVLLSSAAVNDCTTLELRRCSDPSLKYDPRSRRCQPMSEREQLTCRQTTTT